MPLGQFEYIRPEKNDIRCPDKNWRHSFAQVKRYALCCDTGVVGHASNIGSMNTVHVPC